MLELLTDPHAWASLLTLTFLEIILGIDNLIFISLITQKLPEAQQPAARRTGLILALVGRLLLLASISWIFALNEPLFTLMDFAVSWRDIILGAGGLFLIVKATLEIHHHVEGDGEIDAALGTTKGRATNTFLSAITQIFLLDLVFSIDSVFTAIGMAEHIPIMVTAIMIAIGVMLLLAEPISGFVKRHPTVKMLALSFLLLIGVTLLADAGHFHIERGYIYAAIAFSLLVEALNLLRKRRLRGQKA